MKGGAAGTGSWPCLRAQGDAGCVLLVAVMPNAKRTAADGLFDGALRVRLAAPPIEGRANAALVAWLAGELELPRRAVEIARGDHGRRKALAVAAPAAQVAAWLRGAVPDAVTGAATGAAPGGVQKK